MPVTKGTYTLSAVWTTSGFAQVFEDCLTGAGYLPSGWYSRTTVSGLENRVLQVVNDATKQKGIVYYHFQFSPTVLRVRTALQWNPTTGVPSGVAGQDFVTGATGNINADGSNLLLTAASGTDLTCTYYKSQFNPSFNTFVMKNGSASTSFVLHGGDYNCLPFINQDSVAFNGAVTLIPNSILMGGNSATVTIRTLSPPTRSTYLGAAALRTISTTNIIWTYSNPIHTVGVYGNVSNVTSNLNSTNGLALPVAMTNTASGITSDYLPVYTAPVLSPYLPPAPSDFAFIPFYASSGVAVGDTFVVSSGVEEYEIIVAANNVTGNAGKIFFGARTV